MPSTYSLPPLQSGGLMLTYDCTNACRHCLYRCRVSKRPTFMSEAMIDRVFAMLAREPALGGMHLAGGEATMNMDRLLYALGSACDHGVRIDYLETNAGWCESLQAGRERFGQLRDAGLDAVLISASLFHNEFIPLARTENAIAAATETFGRGGVIVWTPNVLQQMRAHLDPERTHTLRESCDSMGLTMADVWGLHSYLTPNGRAAEALSEGLRRRPADAFAGDACAATLPRTSHFHITPGGLLYTGLCPGIVIGSVDEPHREYTAEEVPLYDTLCTEGPVGLMDRAGEVFTPDERGYVSKCHLCQEVRKALYATGAYAELRPAEFYA